MLLAIRFAAAATIILFAFIRRIDMSGFHLAAAASNFTVSSLANERSVNAPGQQMTFRHLIRILCVENKSRDSDNCGPCDHVV